MEVSERHLLKMARLHLSSPPRNPRLQKMRDNLTKSYNEEEIGLIVEILAFDLSQIHASYLFHPKGWKALKAICTFMSSTPTLLEYNSWKDLAGVLNLSVLQIGCIENYKNADYTQNVLLSYALKKDATLGKLVEALHQIQRVDAITASQAHLKALGLEAINENIEMDSKDDIICPKAEFLLDLRQKAFITLKDMEVEYTKQIAIDSEVPDEFCSKTVPQIQIPISQIAVQQAVPARPNNVPNCSKKVMVTFAEDGEQIARALASKFRIKRGNVLPIGVLILDDHKEKVLSNPENFIIHYFHKMDYVIPIVTEGYLARIGGESGGGRSALSCLDPQYVQLIHDLMLKYYYKNTCRNNKIRCIIPDNNYKKILRHPHMEIDPVLQVYMYESEAEQLAKRILRIYN